MTQSARLGEIQEGTILEITTCVHELDTKVAVLDLKCTQFESALANNTEAHGQIQGSLHNIETHIAKQNGALPYIKEQMDKLIIQFDAQAKQTIGSNVKVGIIWSIFTAIIVGAAMWFIKGN